MKILVIRNDRQKDLVLTRTKEGVYFIYQYGQMVDNSLDYDKMSDRFNQLIKNR